VADVTGVVNKAEEVETDDALLMEETKVFSLGADEELEGIALFEA
jgi:hypothetical protein